jgi:5-methylcytosine-specific restriction endonuclease McrA
MGRNQNTDRHGGNWSEAAKQIIWNKGSIIPDYSQELWRRDKCGQVMKYSDYGNRFSKNGWEIDHINPVVNGGLDIFENLQPLHWKNNAEKGDSLNWSCPRV